MKRLLLAAVAALLTTSAFPSEFTWDQHTASIAMAMTARANCGFPDADARALVKALEDQATHDGFTLESLRQGAFRKADAFAGDYLSTTCTRSKIILDAMRDRKMAEAEAKAVATKNAEVKRAKAIAAAKAKAAKDVPLPAGAADNVINNTLVYIPLAQSVCGLTAANEKLMDTYGVLTAKEAFDLPEKEIRRRIAAGLQKHQNMIAEFNIQNPGKSEVAKAVQVTAICPNLVRLLETIKPFAAKYGDNPNVAAQ